MLSCKHRIAPFEDTKESAHERNTYSTYIVECIRQRVERRKYIKGYSKNDKKKKNHKLLCDLLVR